MSDLALLKYGIFLFAGVGTLTVGWSLVVRRGLSQAAKSFLLVGAAAFALAFYAFKIEPNWIEVNRVVIRDPELARMLGGLKMVQIADLHLTDGLGWRENQLVKKVNGLQPDFIFVTGDFADDLTQIEPTRQLLARLKAKIGIWGVPGNTDHISLDGRSLASELARSGIRILVNEAERIQGKVGKYLWLAGVDDPVYGYANLKQTLGGVPPGSPTILLAHSPDIFEEAVKHEIPLVLVGHTHGGQIGIPFFIGFSDYANRTPYMRGHFKKGSTQMYVNRGIGTKTLSVRFLCRPEISVIEIKP